MIEELSESRDNILALRISGKIKEDDYDVLNPAMEQLLKRTNHPKMFMEIGKFEGITANAIIEDLKNIPDYNKFEKIAVVGEKDWKETLTNIFDPMLNPEAKYFAPEEKQKAFEWLRN
jgi:hypothetical protein